MTFATISSYEIGTTYAGRVNVEAMTTKRANMAPLSAFVPYSEVLPTGAAGATTRGFAYTTWQWPGFIYADMFNALRAICPGASASVIIRTLKEDYATFEYYSAIMIWPDPSSYEQIMTTKGLAYRGLIIKHNALVVYTP